MPYSDDALAAWISNELLPVAPLVSTVVDVGAGAGAMILRFGQVLSPATWTAVEIWEPYVDRFGLRSRYNKVIVGDIRTMDLPPADLYIFGDVLEHMQEAEAVSVWNAARRVSRFLLAGMPVLPYPQGEAEGNPFEAHLHQWDMIGVLDRLKGIYTFTGPRPGSLVGAFMARGEAA